jgi:hypothetical protein
VFQSSHLFKFVGSVSAVENMLEGRLRFSTVEELNDPCELAGEINEEMVYASLAEFRKTGYSETEYEWLCKQGALLQALSPQSQAIPVPRNAKEAHGQIMSSFYDDASRMAQLQRAAVRDIKSKAGILSLTTNWASLPMWAHYGANADGFVVVFEELDRYFYGNDTGILDQVQPVSYSDVFEGMTFRPSSQKNLFFWKYSDWSYERESRVISALKSCQKIAVGSTTMWLREIDPRVVCGVIIGWKVEDEVRQRLVNFSLALNREIKLFEAKFAGVSVAVSRLVI